jgi:hypothetical protein
MPSIAPCLPVLLLFRQALRNFRVGVPASTPFIGQSENNFSHKFQNRFCPRLSQADSSCPASVHTLSRSASTAVSSRSIALSRFATGAERFGAAQSARRPSFAQKNSGKRIASCRHRP